MARKDKKSKELTLNDGGGERGGQGGGRKMSKPLSTIPFKVLNSVQCSQTSAVP